MKLCLNRPAKQYLFLSLVLTTRCWGKYKEVVKCVGGVEVVGIEPAQPNGL